MLNSEVRLKDSNGIKAVKFVDAFGAPCSIQEVHNPPIPQIWLGTDECRMLLDQHLARELLPFLQHFIEHGNLP